MWESRRDFQRVWEGWKAGFMAFHAFHTLSFPWPAFTAIDSFSKRKSAILCPRRTARSETSPMSKTGIEKSVKLLWVVGIGVWGSMVALLWWHLYEAQTFAQASLNSTRLGLVSAIGIFWSLAGAAWLAKLKKTRTT